jgi:glycosyltransferase involved in cell wall biosynthesis
MKLSANSYLERFAFCERQIAIRPQRDLAMIVVIPCFNEPDLIASLKSLRTCDRPGCSVEIIVVINSSVDSSQDISRQNQIAFSQASEWISEHHDSRLAFHLLQFPELPAKQAGVGLARKIGMDEAVRRFSDAGRLDGIITCYDADCQCDPNYLTSIERHFERHPRSPGCSIYFEHPLEGPLDSSIYDAIAAYELHLRYYIQALRYAGCPYAYHTIGSSMAVRSDVYQQQGGMNKRQAGEDFYFLQKVISLGGFSQLNETRVIPSPRTSDRVPFGTGRAVREYLHSGKLLTYPLRAFLDVKELLDRVPSCYRSDLSSKSELLDGLPKALQSFLQTQRCHEALQEIRENTSSETAFRKRFFRWFNAFMAMKFIHHARDAFYGQGEVNEEAGRLLERLGVNQPDAKTSIRVLLEIYRQLDRRPE